MQLLYLFYYNILKIATKKCDLYGEGEELEATIYEVASYTQRGDRFFRNPNVQLKDRHDF